MIDEAKTRLENHSKQFNSMHTFNTPKWLGETMLARVRTMKYELFDFIESDNQTITFSPELNMRKLIRERGLSVFSGTSKLVSSAYLNMMLRRESGWRSLSIMTYPIPNPWTVLQVMAGRVLQVMARCSADLRTASKEANNPVADGGWNVMSFL